MRRHGRILQLALTALVVSIASPLSGVTAGTTTVRSRDHADIVREPAPRPHVFDVTAYGAKGDGATDDTRAVEMAYAACAKAGGGTVFFPQGHTFRTVRFVVHSGHLLRVLQSVFCFFCSQLCVLMCMHRRATNTDGVFVREPNSHSASPLRECLHSSRRSTRKQ